MGAKSLRGISGCRASSGPAIPPHAPGLLTRYVEMKFNLPGAGPVVRGEDTPSELHPMQLTVAGPCRLHT
jgi:hypothetical protein